MTPIAINIPVAEYVCASTPDGLYQANHVPGKLGITCVNMDLSVDQLRALGEAGYKVDSKEYLPYAKNVPRLLVEKVVILYVFTVPE